MSSHYSCLRRLLSGHTSCLLASFAAVLALLTSCAKRESRVQVGNREQVLHRSLGYEVTELDPHIVTGTAEAHVLGALFEGLVTEDPVDLHPVPGVAEKWDISPDSRVYTFHLRADAKWSDGTPVTAADFVASYQRILTASLAADYANLLYVLQGAEAYHKGAQKDFAQVGVAALDPRTLRLTLDHPVPYFLSLLTQMSWMPVPVATIAKHGDPYHRGNTWTRAGRIVSNGAFMLKEWRTNEVITVVKSPHYWDAKTVKLKAVNFYPTDSVDAEERGFRAGQYHVTDFVPVGKVVAYRRDSPHLIRLDPYLGTYFYRLNVNRPPLGDVRIRRALAMSVDRQAIVEKVLRGGQLPAHFLTPPDTNGYTPTARIPTDFAAARELLKSAGYEGGRGLPTIELLYNTSENHRIVAEAIQEMWRRELGITVTLVNQELKVAQSARRSGQFQILRGDWIGDFNDPATFLDVFRSDSGNNYTGWTNADYDTALFTAARTSDPAARNALFQKAEAILLADTPIIPIYHYTHIFLLQPSVKGWHPTALDHHPLKYVWLEP